MRRLHRLPAVSAGLLKARCNRLPTGDPGRFRNAGELASYVGAIPRLHQSGNAGSQAE